MNFTVGIIAAVGILVAISLVMISMDPGYLSGIPVKPAEEQIACTLDYTPMCGVDGVTYGNMCMLNATKIKLDHPGECITVKPVQAGWQRMESLQHQGIGHESHQAVMILPLGDKVYSGTLQYDASEPVQLITLHGPLKEGEEKGQATWTLDGVTKYALTFVDQKNATGTWIFSGNALAVHTKKTTPFTVDYTLENTEKAISEFVKTGTIQSQQDSGLGESEQLAMILAPSSDVYSGIISYSASEPIQIVTMHGPLGPTERPVKAWIPDGESIYAFNLLDSASKMGSLEFSGNALAVYRNNSTQFTVSYSVSATTEPVEIPHAGMPVAPVTFTVSIPQGVSSPGCEVTKECYLSNSVEIRVHDTVIWSNDDIAAHTVTSGSSSSGSDGLFDSGLFMAGNTFAYTFEEAGTYPYFCMVHPWMTGEIAVTEINDMIVNPIAVGEPSVSEDDASTEKIKTMVSNAITLYDKIGEASFESFNSNPDFRDGNLYVFVFRDSDTIMVSHGASESMIGKPVNEILDVNGDSIGKMIHEKATEEGVWVEYLWEDPVDQKIYPKTSWVIIHDGYIFGSGSYVDVEPIVPVPPENTTATTPVTKPETPPENATISIEPEVEPTEKRAAPVEVKMAIGSGVPGCDETQECYLPYKAEIYPGEPVVWNNIDSAAHTVTSGISGTADGKFDSGMIMSGQTWQFLFADSGEYDYYCMIHPWMTGKVIVS
ncbi:MAG: blue (type1) copper protein [Nitrosarchaeum sp.]|nr:blue (type1) copper protein [Nitrosarchaeum sp.]